MKTPTKMFGKANQDDRQKARPTCLICNSDTKYDQQMYFENGTLSFNKLDRQFDNGIQNPLSRDIKDNQKYFYKNILCSQCEMKFNTKENQLNIFKKLIGFFESSGTINCDKDTHSINSYQKDQSKLKIKDLIRLVMHMLNEITSLAKTVHYSFDKLMNIQCQTSLEINTANTSKLQTFIQEHQRLDGYQDQSHNQNSPFQLQQQIEQNNLIQAHNSEEDEGEGKGKQSINSFSMESPFAKQPKRKFKQTNIIMPNHGKTNSGYNDKENKFSNNPIKNRNFSMSEANSFSISHNQNELFLIEHDQNNKVNKSIEFSELGQLNKPKSGNIKPNIPQIPSKRYQTVNKSVGNQMQLLQQKGGGVNNTLNISICSNNDFPTNSFFTNHSPSMMLMMGAQTSQNQSVINNQPIFDFHSSKNSAQQVIFGDGPASRKLLNIKQALERQNSPNILDTQNNQQQKQNIQEQQSQLCSLQKQNQVRRASSLSKESKIIDKKKTELNGLCMYSNNVQQINEQVFAVSNSNKQFTMVKPDLKNNLPQIPSSTSSSSQNCVNSTNCISQTHKSRSYQGSALELAQLTEGVSSSMNITTVQNEMLANNVQDLSQTQRFINLANGGSPETPTQSDIDITLISQKNLNRDAQNFEQQEIKQNIKQVKSQAPPPKTLKYKKSNLQQSKNIIQSQDNSFYNENIQNENIDKKINKFSLNQTMKMDQYSSADNSIMGGLKSLNNSINMSYLNKSMFQDSCQLSQSALLNSKTYTTTPIQEKIIIKGLMKNEYGDTLNSGYHQENSGMLNEAKYIISAQWWREWMEYVGFNEIVSNQQDTEVQIKKDRPKKLKNKCLLKGEQLYSFKNTKNIELKDNLLEHYDYEAISKAIFGYIKMWYGVDYEIIRFLKFDPSQPQDKSVYLDLYPEKTLAYSLPMGIRKRQKNSTLGATNSQNLKDKKENQTTFFYSNKTLPSKNTKFEKLNNTEVDQDSLLKSKEINIDGEEGKQNLRKKRQQQSLDLDKINITLIESRKNLNSNKDQMDESRASNSQRSVAKDKSKACTIF